MSTGERVALAAIIVAVDVLVFAVPLTALAAAYVLVARPPRLPRLGAASLRGSVAT